MITRIKPALFLLVLSIFISGCGMIPTLPWGTIEPTDAPVAPVHTSTLPAYPIEPTATQQATLPFAPDPTLGPVEENPTPIPQPEFILQEGSPFYLPNFNHPDAGCDWLGIAGQVFDADGTEIQGLFIRTAEKSALTGDAMAYGPGGYEIQVGDSAVNSSGNYWIQVFDDGGLPLSNRVFVDTFEDCQMNLVLVNFVRASEEDFPTPTSTLGAYP